MSACPARRGFVGEFLTLVGIFKVNTWVALFATTGVILSAAYALWLYRKVIFGALTKESLKGLLDLSTREKAILYPLVVLVIFYGVYPAPIFDATDGVGRGAAQQRHRFARRRQDGGGELTRLAGMTADLSSSLSLAGPELIVAGGALVLLMLGVYRGEGANRAVWPGWPSLVLVVAGACGDLFRRRRRRLRRCLRQRSASRAS